MVTKAARQRLAVFDTAKEQWMRSARRTLTAVAVVTAVCCSASPALADPGVADEGALGALAVVPGLLDEASAVSPAVVDVTEDLVSLGVPGASGEVHALQLVSAEEGAVAAPAAAGITVISSTAPDTDTVVQELADGVRVVEVIGSSVAPTDFEYRFDVPYGMDLLPQEDGSIVIGVETRTGDEVTLDFDAVIGAPWAFDADGRAVPASYEASTDGTVTMKVEHSDDLSYPVVADPALTAGGFQASWNIFSPHLVSILLNKARSADAEDVGSLICIGVAFIPVVGTGVAAACGAHNIAIRAAARYGACQRWTVNAFTRSFQTAVYTGGFCR